MGTVSRVHTFASGAILTAAQLNNEFDNLLTSSAINGGLDATNLGVTAGQAAASKALVVDASRNLADATGSNRINNLALSGTFESTGAITATAGITSGGNIVSDTDSTDDLGTTGVRWANLFVDDVTVTNNVTIGGTLTLTGGITLNGNTTIGDSSADTLTVNSTITSNLIFTDNTYDIGASGATRPRDLFLSRNAVMGGTLGVTGATTLSSTLGVTGLITASGGVSGALTGNVTGNVTGNLTGDVTGNISGNVTGGTISGTTGTFTSTISTSGGYVTVAGNPSAGTISSNGNGQIGGLTGNGLYMYGKGSTYDLVLANATTNTALAIPTGTHNVLFSPNVGGGSAGNLTVKTGSINSDSIRLEAGGTTSTWLESRGYLGHSWYVDSTRSMTLDSTGLGIGTSSPDEKLTISSPFRATSQDWQMLIANSDSFAADKGGGIAFGGSYTGSTQTYFSNILGAKENGTDGNLAGYLSFYTRGSGQPYTTERARIDSSGNFGIGTTSPAAPLHIIGGDGDPSATHSGDAQLILENNGTTFLEIATGATHYAGLTFSDGTASIGAVAYDHGTALGGGVDSLHFQTAGALKAVITSTGNFGINTVSPTSNAAIHAVTTGFSGASGAIILEDTRTDVNPYIEIKNDARSYSIATVGARSDNFEVYDNTASATRLAIDSSGNVGIGTTSPEAPLEVVADSTVGYAVFLEAAASGTEGAALRGKGTYSIADAGTQTFTVGNGTIVMISENTTGDGAMFFCGYQSATVTLVADPNSRYANTVTAGKISLTKSASSGTVTLTNNSGGTKSFTILKIVCSD